MDNGSDVLDVFLKFSRALGLTLWVVGIYVWKFLVLVFYPVTLLSSYVYHVAATPFRFGLAILEKFESIIIFTSVALTIGLMTGLILHLTTNIISDALELDKPHFEIFSTSSVKQNLEQGRTAASYRAERLQKQAERVRETFLPQLKNLGAKDGLIGENVILSPTITRSGFGEPPSSDVWGGGSGREVAGTTILEEESDVSTDF